MIDLRKDRRIPLTSGAEVKFSSWAAFYEVYTANISRGGMMLQMSKTPSVGERIQVKLQLPKGDEIVLDAEVKFVRPNPMPEPAWVGVQFVDLDAEKLAQIEQLIDDAE
ncbi:MAG: PilZ domain-containing protein [Polyangiales bacterium]